LQLHNINTSGQPGTAPITGNFFWAKLPLIPPAGAVITTAPAKVIVFCHRPGFLNGQSAAFDAARVIADKFTGQSSRFGFVVMSSGSEAQTVISALNGMDRTMHGKKLL
jgi:hypothetical protein